MVDLFISEAHRVKNYIESMEPPTPPPPIVINFEDFWSPSLKTKGGDGGAFDSTVYSCLLCAEASVLPF